MGVLFVVAATVMWGVSPLYYSMLNHVPPFEVVLHRVLWSLPPIAVYALLTGRRARFVETGRDRRKLAALALSAVLVAANWFVFIYAIQIGQAGEASFGYYIYPLATLLLGVAVFGERITALQWVAAGIAALGVFWAGWRFGEPPWIALLVMASFAAYGVIRKLAAVGPMIGVLWELLLIAPLFLLYLLWIAGGAFMQDGATALLLIGGSLFTGVPLVMFVEAAKRLRFSTVGVLFYINPTLQFVSAIILGEAFGVDRIIGFGFIWVAVALYCAELIRQDRRARSASMAASGVSTTS